MATGAIYTRDTPILNPFLWKWGLRLAESEVSQRRCSESDVFEDIPVVSFVVDCSLLLNVTKVDYREG